ncbi:MAG TPA: nickel pincer cofactor biosynthesis protein LarB [Nitrososphaera sp.]|nr:nickel pincer cofactor biosynthesis protein LarB [Nitrososphaera sp.]
MADLHSILSRFANGSLTLSEVEREISIHAVEKIGEIAQLDVNREMRKGMPEIIFSENKEYRDIIRIALAAIRNNGQVVVSRIRKNEVSKVAAALRRKEMDVEIGRNSTTLLASDKSFGRKMINGASIGIMAAGTSDVGVAEEARLVAKAMACYTITSYDIGIAGIHRLFPALKEMMLQQVGAIVVVAGMEGALASVVASMVDVPVIGVPTSVGYGFGGNGVAALASMLQSCTLGLAVMNIDNGVGAGAYAATIAKRTAKKS